MCLLIGSLAMSSTLLGTVFFVVNELVPGELKHNPKTQRLNLFLTFGALLTTRFVLFRIRRLSGIVFGRRDKAQEERTKSRRDESDFIEFDRTGRCSISSVS